MESTYTTIEGELPQDVICLEHAKEKVTDERLEETIDLSMENGYFLVGIEDDPIFGTEYTLERLEVEG